ncbi:protein kinase domain-containing protein [Plantactinospora sp. CA-290183]|uniref:protein kinase domain-containing protein n=1 Tax=Plantactinospora sp. CA-290183 TaxID=3240006 RepID=UPI003D946774
MATPDIGELVRLGDGPTATVYSGQHRGVPVALKVFPRRLDKRTMAAFSREQSTLAGLRRFAPILPVDGVDELPTGEPVARMELCPQSLAGLVGRVGPLNPVDVVVIGRTVALALAAAHRAGLPHGGISPHNVLFRASGEPVVSDFGVTLRQAMARAPLSAVDYLPPEALGTGALDQRGDLYALGAVLHFALTGRPPYPGRLGEQPGDRVRRILGEPVPVTAAEGVPEALATLVVRLLAADPAERPMDAGEVADQLGALLPEPPPESDVDEFDDFAGAPPVPVPEQAPPAPPPPAPAPDPAPTVQVTAYPDEFDDFAAPAPMPPVAGPAPIAPVAEPAPMVPVAGPAPMVPVAGPAAIAPVAGVGGGQFAVDPRPSDPEPLAAPAVPPAGRPGRATRYALVAGCAVLVGVLVWVLARLLTGDPQEIAATPPQVVATPGSGVSAPGVELDAPGDGADKVKLTWRSGGGELEFAVVVAEEGEPTRVLPAGRDRSMTVPVEPGRRYCFLVQATDGTRVYESAAVPLRGATCRR